MEKISGIVKSSPRVQSVDLKSTSAVRPGTPSFGRPTGISTLIDKAGPSTAQRAVALHNEIMDNRRATAEQPDIVRNMANKFFMEQGKPAESITEDIDINETILRDQIKVNTPTLNAGKATDEEYEVQPEANETEEWVPPGTYIDVVA